MEPVTLFYATNNASKLHNMYYRLRNYPIKVLCPDDLDIHLDIDENGDSVVANARIKAEKYFEKVHMPTIAGDTGVYIDGLSGKDQPGLYVRRVNGKTLSNDEMIEYYSNLVRKSGNVCYIRYFTGIVLITSEGIAVKEIHDPPMRLSAQPNVNRKHNGNPLDVLTLVEDGRYYNDLSDEERTGLYGDEEEKFTDFVVKNLYQ